MLNTIEIIKNMSMRKPRRKDTQKKEIYKGPTRSTTELWQ